MLGILTIIYFVVVFVFRSTCPAVSYIALWGALGTGFLWCVEKSENKK